MHGLKLYTKTIMEQRNRIKIVQSFINGIRVSTGLYKYSRDKLHSTENYALDIETEIRKSPPNAHINI